MLTDLDEIALDHYFPRSAVAEMVNVARATQTARDGWFAAAAFRDGLEADGQIVGRKVAIQILEFLDRHGVTIRRGDQRRVNPRRLDLFEPDRGAAPDEHGGESSPVGRPDFKSGWGRQTVPGGFDSHSLPPASKGDATNARSL